MSSPQSGNIIFFFLLSTAAKENEIECKKYDSVSVW